jgi:hypothetical protein
VLCVLTGEIKALSVSVLCVAEVWELNAGACLSIWHLIVRSVSGGLLSSGFPTKALYFVYTVLKSFIRSFPACISEWRILG